MCQTCETSKKCNDCGLIKPVSSFPTAGKKADGSPKFHFICRDCKRIRDKKYDEDKRDKEKARQVVRKYYSKPENKEAQRQYQKVRYIESNASQDITIIKCAECGSTELIRRKSDRKECLRCQSRLRYRIDYERYKFKLYQRPSGTIDNCKRCGVEYSLTGGGNEMYCPLCREKNRRDRKRNDKRKRRNAKRISGVIETVIDIKVFERDKWRCKMCGCKVQKKDVNAGNAAELDHIIPIAKQGIETYSNVQTLCRNCNQSKRDKLVGQLVMML